MPNSISLPNHAAAVYRTHDQAEGAIKFLRNCGHEMNHLSIIGQSFASDEPPIGFIKNGYPTLSSRKLGAFWGSLGGLAFDSAVLYVPDVGYIMFGGWLVAALDNCITSGNIATLADALACIGMQSDRFLGYEQALKAGRSLVFAHGNSVCVRRAMNALTHTTATTIESYSIKRAVETEGHQCNDVSQLAS